MSPIPAQLWIYRARVERVIDGDTLDVVVDAGFRGYRVERLRLLGVNTPEVRGPSRLAGLAATEFVRQWLAQCPPADECEWPLIIVTHKSDAFGRYLARAWRVVDGACLNDALIEAGQAIPFMEDTP